MTYILALLLVTVVVGFVAVIWEVRRTEARVMDAVKQLGEKGFVAQNPANNMKPLTAPILWRTNRRAARALLERKNAGGND